MSETVPGGIYRSADGNYHNAEGNLIPEKDALEALAKIGVKIELPPPPPLSVLEAVAPVEVPTVVAEHVMTAAEKRAAKAAAKAAG